MKVLFDHQAFEMQPYGGISRYYYELIKEFGTKNNIDPIISLKRTNNQYIKTIINTPGVTITPSTLRGFPEKKFSSYDAYGNIASTIIWNIRLNFQKYINKKVREENQQNTLHFLKNNEYDIFHPTYYNPYYIKSINNKPFILTIHDLIQEKFPELFPLRDDAIRWKSDLVKKASHIIAVSNTTKKDIMSFYKIPDKKISVIYHGSNFSQKEEENLINYTTLPSNFLLYVGERHLHKNFYFMVESLKPTLLRDPDLYLVCCGGGKFNESEKYYFKFLGLSNKILNVESPEMILKMCYKKAIALIYPSLYEGFGIPLIEAFSMGCPVVASNIPTTQEICSDAYIGFDSKDPNSLENAIQKVISEKIIRDNIVEKGYKRMELFSWRLAAEKTLLVYDTVLSG